MAPFLITAQLITFYSHTLNSVLSRVNCFTSVILGLTSMHFFWLIWNPEKTAEIKLANLSYRKYFHVTVACILFSHLNAILKYFLNYATRKNTLFHIPELKDTSPFKTTPWHTTRNRLRFRVF